MEHENLSLDEQSGVSDHGGALIRIASLLVAAFLAYALSLAVIEYQTPLTRVPGPWLARYSRLWLLKAILSRKFERINVDLHRRLGPVVRIAPNEYSIDDPDAISTIFRSRDPLQKDEAPWYEAWGLPDEEATIFGITNTKHHLERRRQVSSFYTMSAISELAFRIDDVSRLFFDKIAIFAAADEAVDICQWMRLYAFDAIGSITFGQLFGCLEHQRDVVGLMSAVTNFARYGSVMGVFSEWHTWVFRVLQFITPQGNVGLVHMRELGENVIDQMRAEGSDDKHRGKKPNELEWIKSDLVTSMTEKHRRHPDEFSRADIIYHMLPNVAAGAETTAATLIAVIYYLCKHPPVLSRLRAELDGWAADQPKRDQDAIISYSEASKLHYLQAVLKETMRLFPATGKGLTRVVPTGGLVIANHSFPEGTIVGINAWVAHANREVYGLDADEFRPERWLGDAKSVTRMEQNFLAFGHGPRYCIGKNIALSEIATFIPELLLRYDIRPAIAEQEWALRNDWFMFPSNFPVKIRQRAMPLRDER